MTVQSSAYSPADSAESPVAEISSGVSMRVVLLSLTLAVFFGYVIPIVDMKMRNTFLGATHLPPGAIAVLLLLLLAINPVLNLMAAQPSRRVFLLIGTLGLGLLCGAAYSKWGVDGLLFWILLALTALALLALMLGTRPFSRNESLTVYISCLFSCLVPGHGAENVFVVNLIGPFYYATRENKWLEFLEPSLRPWMTPALSTGGGYAKNDAAREMVGGWFLGVPGGHIPWNAWLVPLVIWTLFIFVLYFMMGCLCIMLRAQWVEREALAFPLLRLPLEMTEGVGRPDAGLVGRFFRNPLMWIGFAIPVFIQTLNGWHLYNADVPIFPLSVNTTQLFTEAPWNQIGSTPIVIWPIVLGISYLLTTEVSFSFWFFFWFIRLEAIGAYYLGFPPASLPTAVGGIGGAFKAFTYYQQIGVYIAYVLLVLWTAREHLLHIARRGFGRTPMTEAERAEPMSYPAAFWGFLGSFALIVGWSIAAGLTPLLALVMWSLYLIIIIALTRIVSEAGILFVQQGWVPLGTIGQITNAGGAHWLLPSSSLPSAALLQGSFMTDLRGFVMPQFMQGFKLAHERKSKLRPLFALMLACSFIALSLGIYMNVQLGYSRGGLSLDPWYSGAASWQPATGAASLIKGVHDASWFNAVWTGIGMVMTLVMMAARSRFTWFPLHPIGFLLSQTYPIAQIWFSIFLGWLFKVIISRFGGAESYRKATPVFLGLVMGEVTMMLFWLAVDGFTGQINHKFMPG